MITKLTPNNVCEMVGRKNSLFKDIIEYLASKDLYIQIEEDSLDKRISITLLTDNRSICYGVMLKEDLNTVLRFIYATLIHSQALNTFESTNSGSE